MPLDRTTMRTSLQTTYLVPAFLLNPVILLHSLNTILSRVLPPVAAATASATDGRDEPLYTPLGPSPRHPHLDVHASDSFCWSYTLVMVVVQMIAFTKVIDQRAALERRQRRQRRQKEGKTRTEQLHGGESPGDKKPTARSGRGNEENEEEEGEEGSLRDSECSGSDDGGSMGREPRRGRKKRSSSGCTSREQSGGEAF